MSNETPNQAAPGNDHLKQLIVALERRTEGQSKILHLIAESLQGIEAHLRQIALSSNPAPNYQRPLNADFREAKSINIFCVSTGL
jgi:hypothetical protein